MLALPCVMMLTVAPADAVERKLLVASFENIVVVGDIDVAELSTASSSTPSAVTHLASGFRSRRSGG